MPYDRVMDKERANRIYDILVDVAGANESERGSFVQEMLSENPTREWRFCGHLGFGGKYRPQTNTVDCYSEDLNDTKIVIINETNFRLRMYVRALKNSDYEYIEY